MVTKLLSLVIDVPEESLTVSIKNIVYFYPKLTESLTADQLHVLTGCL
jgi:hypothetical protein